MKKSLSLVSLSRSSDFFSLYNGSGMRAALWCGHIEGWQKGLKA